MLMIPAPTVLDQNSFADGIDAGSARSAAHLQVLRLCQSVGGRIVRFVRVLEDYSASW